MTSEAQLYVWIFLPGQGEPVVCGRFRHRTAPGGGQVGSFVYGRSYLARANALPLDPIALPLAEREFTTTHLSGWFPVLLDAGPDEWGRRLIERLHGPQDTLGYLLRARGQSVGALAFSPAPDVLPADHREPPRIGQLEHLLQLHRAVEDGASIADEDRELLLQGTSAGGARPKTTVEDGGRLWLAKFPSTRDRPDEVPVPIMEAALLDLAAACDIRVPRHRVVDVAEAPVLLVERFDRVRVGKGLYARLRYASARTVLWSRPDVQAYSYMGSYSNLARQMRVWERAPSEHLRELYRRIAFNCLVGNTDDHDCNTGFVAGDDDFFALSPAFDLTSRRATPRMFLAMGFGVEGAVVSMDNLLSESQLFGYGRDEAGELVRSMWKGIRRRLVPALVRHGCAEGSAAQALTDMPGQRLLG
jgi:serine/threonine-protein kinase HipA